MHKIDPNCIGEVVLDDQKVPGFIFITCSGCGMSDAVLKT